MLLLHSWLLRCAARFLLPAGGGVAELSRRGTPRQLELKFECLSDFRYNDSMRRFMTSRSGRWPVLLMFAGGLLSGSGFVRGDIVEQSFRDSKGQKSATGFVLQGSRNMKKLGKRRSTTSSVILPPLSLETLSKKVPEQVQAAKPKPRFGYGSDYEAEGRSQIVKEPQSAAPVSVDPGTVIQFLSVKPNRTYYPRIPYYGYSSNPYFYRPGTAGRYYLHSPYCHAGGYSSGTAVNVYHGGSLTYSSWSPFSGYRYFR